MGLQTREGVVDQIHVNGRPLRESSESQKEGATKEAIRFSSGPIAFATMKSPTISGDIMRCRVTGTSKKPMCGRSS